MQIGIVFYRHLKLHEQAMSEHYSVVSLFAGIGGICKAFHLANCNVIWANELDSRACQTYRLNNTTGTTLIEADIREVEEVPSSDIIVAGFPCQPFSLAGYRHGLKDPRGKLFMEITRIANGMEELPRVLFLENVSNLYSHDGGKTYGFVKQTLIDAGYPYVTEKVMNTKDYSSIPQSRPRIYIVAFRDENDYRNFTFPDKTSYVVPINSLIDRTTPVPNKYYYTPENFKHYDLLIKEVTDYHSIYQFRRSYFRMNKNHLCPALTASMGRGGHNVPIIIDDFGHRKLTPEECLKFQGFPENFTFPKIGDSYKYMQIGNSVTIPVVESIANNIVYAMDSTDHS